MESPPISPPEHTEARTLLPPLFFLSASRTEARLTARFQLLGLKLHCFRGDLNSPKVTLLSREGLSSAMVPSPPPSFYRFKVELFCFLEQVNTTFRFSFWVREAQPRSYHTWLGAGGKSGEEMQASKGQVFGKGKVRGYVGEYWARREAGIALCKITPVKASKNLAV